MRAAAGVNCHWTGVRPVRRPAAPGPGQRLSLGRWKEGVPRGGVVRIQTVHHQHHLFRVRISLLPQIPDPVRPIPAGTLRPGCHMHPAGQRLHFQEDSGGVVAPVLDPCRPGPAGRGAVTSPTSCLLVLSLHTTGRCGSYGRGYTSSTSSLRATHGAFSVGGMCP